MISMSAATGLLTFPSQRSRSNLACFILAGLASVFLCVTLEAFARDTVSDEFTTLAAQIQTPPSAAWMKYAYNTNSMPRSSDRDGVDVLLRRVASLLAEFNQNGVFDALATNLAALQQ